MSQSGWRLCGLPPGFRQKSLSWETGNNQFGTVCTTRPYCMGYTFMDLLGCHEGVWVGLRRKSLDEHDQEDVINYQSNLKSTVTGTSRRGPRSISGSLVFSTYRFGPTVLRHGIDRGKDDVFAWWPLPVITHPPGGRLYTTRKTTHPWHKKRRKSRIRLLYYH